MSRTFEQREEKLCLLSRGKMIIATNCDGDIAAPVDGCDNCTLHCLWRASARYTITPTHFYLHPNQFWSNAILMIIKSLKIPPENIATWILAIWAFSGVDVSHHYSLTRKYLQLSIKYLSNTIYNSVTLSIKYLHIYRPICHVSTSPLLYLARGGELCHCCVRHEEQVGHCEYLLDICSFVKP